MGLQQLPLVLIITSLWKVVDGVNVVPNRSLIYLSSPCYVTISSVQPVQQEAQSVLSACHVVID